MKLDKYIKDIESNKETNCEYVVKRFRLPYQTAEDIHQETIAYLLERDNDSFDSSRDFAPWYFTIFRNKVLDYLRKRKSRANIENAASLNDEICLINKNNSEEHIYEEVRKEINKLDPKYSNVIKMHYWENMSAREMGEKIGIDASTVRWRINEARKKMRLGLLNFINRKAG